MENRNVELKTIRRIANTKKDSKEIKFIKLKNKYFSNFKSELIKNSCKMPLIKKKAKSFKLHRVWSPTKLHELKQRLKSPINRRENSSKLNTTARNIQNLSPITKKLMFIEFTNEQTQLINRISSRIEEARSFRYQGFRSPRVLANSLLKEMNSQSMINYGYLRVPNRPNFIESPTTAKNNESFAIKRLKSNTNNLNL